MFRRLARLLLYFFTVCMALIYASTAYAGEFKITKIVYDGKVTIRGGWATQDKSYTWQQAIQGRGGCGWKPDGSFVSDTVVSSGTVTYTVAWEPSSANDPAPPNAVVSVRERFEAWGGTLRYYHSNNTHPRLWYDAKASADGGAETVDTLGACSSREDRIVRISVGPGGTSKTIALSAQCSGVKDYDTTPSPNRYSYTRDVSAGVIFNATIDTRSVNISSSFGDTYYREAATKIAFQVGDKVLNKRAEDGSMKADTVLPDPSVEATYTANLSGKWVNPKYDWSSSIGSVTSNLSEQPVIYTNHGANTDRSDHVTLTVTDSDGASAVAKFKTVFHTPVGFLPADRSDLRPRYDKHMSVTPTGNSTEAWDYPSDWTYFKAFDAGTEATITGVLNGELAASLTITGTRTRTGEVTVPDIGKITNALALAIGFTPSGKLSFSVTSSEKITVPKGQVARAYAGMSYGILKPKGSAWDVDGYQYDFFADAVIGASPIPLAKAYSAGYLYEKVDVAL